MPHGFYRGKMRIILEITTTQVSVGIITLFTQFIQAFAGFGAAAVGLPIVSMLMKVSEASAILNTNGTIVALLITVFKRRQINWREYRRIVILMLPFIPIGLLISSLLMAYDMYLKILLGIIVVFISGRYIFYTCIKKKQPAVLGPKTQLAALFSGAVIQGLFGTGGPLVTLYTAARIHEKGELRATMSAVWSTVNIVIISYRLFVARIYTELVWSSLAFSIPFLAVGFCAGMAMHKRVKNESFIKALYFILLFGGIMSLYGGIKTAL